MFNLATLAIAFMATSTATAQKNGQINLYNSTDCIPDSYLNSIQSGLNNCSTTLCEVISFGPERNNLSLEIFSDQPDNPTTCQFFNKIEHLVGGCGGISFGQQNSSQGCQAIPAQSGNDSDLSVFMACYIGDASECLS